MKIEKVLIENLVEDVIDVEETTGPKLPVTLLSAEQVRNVARTGLKKGKFISLGYLRKIPVAAQFASGKINKITGEVYPIVKIIKLIEDNGVTGIEYGQLKAIKKRNARTEAEVKQILGELTPEEAEEQSPVPTEWVVKNVIQIHPTTRNELLAYYPLGGTAKVKYYVSINGDDYKEVHRDDIRQWMTPGAAQKELEKTFDASMKGKYDNEENETVNFNYRLITQLYQLRQGDTVLGADFIKTPKRRNKLTLNDTDDGETTATEEVTESKKALKETFKSDEVFTDLKDRAIANYDGNNIEEAVQQAIDEGLIYDEDIYDLAEKYINGGEVLDLYYDFLFDDLCAELKKWDEADL